jgi:hypothetical protein
MFDAAAIEFAREAYAREGRGALFVLPSSQLAVTLPVEARILVTGLNWEPVSTVAGRRYSGRVPGHVFMLLPNTLFDSAGEILETGKARALLSTFKDYNPMLGREELEASNNCVFGASGQRAFGFGVIG